MSITLIQLASADLVLKNTDTTDLPHVAQEALQAGLDSDSLRILAGMDADDNPFEIEDYLQKALKELGYELPNKKQAIIIGLQGLSERIANGQIEPIEGAGILSKSYLRKSSEEDFGPNNKYAYDSISTHMSAIYGEYDSYEDLGNTASQAQLNDLKKHIIDEAKMYIVEQAA